MIFLFNQKQWNLMIMSKHFNVTGFTLPFIENSPPDEDLDPRVLEAIKTSNPKFKELLDQFRIAFNRPENDPAVESFLSQLSKFNNDLSVELKGVEPESLVSQKLIIENGVIRTVKLN